MKERFRPQPENQQQHAPEPGTGPLGLPPPSPDPQPQGGGSKSLELPPRQTNAQELEILAKLQKAKEFLGKLPHPLAPDMLDEMIRSAVKEASRKINWDEMQRQVDKMDEEMMEVLQDPIQRKKFLEGD